MLRAEGAICTCFGQELRLTIAARSGWTSPICGTRSARALERIIENIAADGLFVIKKPKFRILLLNRCASWGRMPRESSRALRVLYVHGLESGPGGYKVQQMRSQGIDVAASSMEMSLWDPRQSNSVVRNLRVRVSRRVSTCKGRHCTARGWTVRCACGIVVGWCSGGSAGGRRCCGAAVPRATSKGAEIRRTARPVTFC